MTKMIKMSLIAAVAVTGMTSAVNAQNLEDAIKGVDVSGYIDYRKEYKAVDGVKADDVNEYAVKVNLKSKVNDMVTANVSVGFDEVITQNTTGTTAQTLTTDANPALTVVGANFAFVSGNTTVIAGKQAIPSVFVDKVDTAKNGAGIVAAHKVNDSLTIAAAHFTNNNIVANSKTSEFIAMGKIADVSIAAHYNITDASGVTANRTYVKADATVAGLNLTGKYATATASDSVSTTYGDASVAQLIAGTKLGNVSLTAAYAKKTQDTGTAVDVAIDSDDDADVNLKVWQLSTDTYGSAEGNVMALTVAMPIMTDLTASLTYASADVDNSATKYDETLAQLTYKMSKNFTLHARYSEMNKDTGVASTSDENKKSRLAIKYTF